MMKRVLSGQVKPLLRIALAFGLVWFVNGIANPFVSGILQFVMVVTISFGLWIIVMRTLFPKGDFLGQ